MSVGARMRDRARQLGISEAEAARRSGVSARRFSFYVKNKTCTSKAAGIGN